MRSIRLDYLDRAITGRFDPIMLSSKKEWDKMTGENSFTRLGCLRWALTHWSWRFKHGHFFILPYGQICYENDENHFHLNCRLFSIYWMKKI